MRNPDGRPGVSTSFSNDDRSHVINDTIWVLPDPAAATSELDQRKNALDGIVTGTPIRSTSALAGSQSPGSHRTGQRG
ncbi:putative conserved membrane protein [Mycobacterium ulcerans str. Harvey]|uniref:Conserved membrane protein n=1 Tax=Mycobacterium ulcerans str. Harvey TaxID=1299332 RepID=A0ABP3AG58_MYCUL|nr:putative conserved membrane protein [Mycobacterium ulcerans str. Harvey]